MSRRYCLACDLVDDEQAIAAYEDWHRVGRTPVAVIKSIRSAGIRNMELYRISNRLVMVIDTADHFSFDDKSRSDASNPAVVDWEARMLEFQRPLPVAGEGEKWLLMKPIFRLTDHADE